MEGRPWKAAPHSVDPPRQANKIPKKKMLRESPMTPADVRTLALVDLSVEEEIRRAILVNEIEACWSHYNKVCVIMKGTPAHTVNERMARMRKASGDLKAITRPLCFLLYRSGISSQKMYETIRG